MQRESILDFSTYIFSSLWKKELFERFSGNELYFISTKEGTNIIYSKCQSIGTESLHFYEKCLKVSRKLC